MPITNGKEPQNYLGQLIKGRAMTGLACGGAGGRGPYRVTIMVTITSKLLRVSFKDIVNFSRMSFI
jgi:hypothetical protein